MRAAACAFALLPAAAAENTEDLITSLPGFGASSTWGFKAYSGFINVSGPVNGYDSLQIHYQFHVSQRSPSDPVVTWHQGGPGGSSIGTGLYGEMGALRIGEDGNYINPWAWNKVANMLYLDSPAGVGGSVCYKGGKAVACQWDDVTQGEAYAHTLEAFFRDFPEFASNDLYMTGESYFGQYGPNIANFIVNNEPYKSKFNLKGIALGNACWGGTEKLVSCVGPSEDRVDVDTFFGKNLFSPKLHKQIYDVCNFPTDPINGPYTTGDDDPSGKDGHAALNSQCKSLLKEMGQQVGPHSIYNVYDNCPNTVAFLARANKTLSWLKSVVRRGMHSPETSAMLRGMNGGFDWDCLGSASSWLRRADVKKALHLDTVTATSRFRYTSSGPASMLLYPDLMRKIPITLYSGDADACVPTASYEDLVGAFEKRGYLSEAEPWRPYFTSNKNTPAGYVTKYAVNGSSTVFTFATIRLAGHMTPQFMPEASFVMFSNFISGGSR